MTEVPFIQTQEGKLTILEQLSLEMKLMKSTMSKRLEDASCIILTGKSMLRLLSDNKLLARSTEKEETLSSVSTLVPTSSMLPQEESLVHTFGNMVLKKLKTMLTLISPTMNQSVSKRKCKLKTKQTKSSCKVIQSASTSKIRKLLNKSSDLTFIKEVSFQAIQSE